MALNMIMTILINGRIGPLKLYGTEKSSQSKTLISMNQIQRTFNIGYNRADDLMCQLEQMGIVSPVIPGKQRSVLIDIEELERILFNNR